MNWREYLVMLEERAPWAADPHVREAIQGIVEAEREVLRLTDKLHQRRRHLDRPQLFALRDSAYARAREAWQEAHQLGWSDLHRGPPTYITRVK